MKLGAITPFQLKKERLTGVDEQSAFCCRWVKYPKKSDAIRFRYENPAGLARLSTSTERCLCSSVLIGAAALQTADIARRLMRDGDLHQDEGASDRYL